MQDALTWITLNWLPVLAALFALLQVINKATDRWDTFTGPQWKRWLLFLSEIGSVVTSREYQGVLGLFKLPLNPYGGRPKSLKPPPVVFPPGPLLLLLAGGLVLSDGCASTWDQSADKSIRSAMVTAQSGWNTARAVYQRRCGAHINSCDNTSGLDLCDSYKACAAERRSHATTFRSVLILCAEASDALQAYRRLKASATNEGPQISTAELDKLKAQVQERVNRATRTSVGFMRALRVDEVVE